MSFMSYGISVASRFVKTLSLVGAKCEKVWSVGRLTLQTLDRISVRWPHGDSSQGMDTIEASSLSRRGVLIDFHYPT